MTRRSRWATLALAAVLSLGFGAAPVGATPRTHSSTHRPKIKHRTSHIAHHVDCQLTFTFE